jgi:hypothetical protein
MYVLYISAVIRMDIDNSRVTHPDKTCKEGNVSML